MRLTFRAQRLHPVLRRDGLAINRKKVHPLYCEEGLQLKARRRKAATVRRPRPLVTRSNERWAMDFMHDVLADGRALRVFTLVEVYMRECVELQTAPAFRGTDVARLLPAAGTRRGSLPTVIQCDSGTEFTPTGLDHWAYWNKVQLDVSRQGKPVDH